MPAKFGPEVWSENREAMIFHFRDEGGSKWTFCVCRSTLEALESDQTITPDEAFGQFRSAIYAAAAARMEAGSPEVQQLLSLQEIQG